MGASTGLAIGKVSTEAFDANEAAFLLKLLAFNLLRRWVQQQPPAIRHWRASWIQLGSAFSNRGTGSNAG